MESLTRVTGIAAPMLSANIDTDQIIPTRFLRRLSEEGLGEGLFAEWRVQADGMPDPTFVLNRAPWNEATILVAGPNFGCGSSREHAPWALLDFGIRCVISTSFADIFYNNCFKNGILPVVVTPDQLKMLLDDAERGANATLTVDLAAQTIRGPDGGEIHFDIDPTRKQILLEGLDDIAGTLKSDSSISAFEGKMAASRPWL